MAQSHTNYTKHDYSSLATERREMFRWNPVTPAIQAWIDKQASTDNFKSYEANTMGEVSGTWPSYIKLLIQNFSDT